VDLGSARQGTVGGDAGDDDGYEGDGEIGYGDLAGYRVLHGHGEGEPARAQHVSHDGWPARPR
jgi:hypothetical protein